MLSSLLNDKLKDSKYLYNYVYVQFYSFYSSTLSFYLNEYTIIIIHPKNQLSFYYYLIIRYSSICSEYYYWIERTHVFLSDYFLHLWSVHPRVQKISISILKLMVFIVSWLHFIIIDLIFKILIFKIIRHNVISKVSL